MLGAVQGPLAALAGYAALDGSCAPCSSPALKVVRWICTSTSIAYLDPETVFSPSRNLVPLTKLGAEIRKLRAEAVTRAEELRKLRAEGPPPAPYWSLGKVAAAFSCVAAAGAAGYALGNRK